MEGAGRSTRYRRAALAALRRPTDGLAEDEVWRDLLQAWTPIAEAQPDVLGVLGYGVTEMVSNAIDHAESPQVEVDYFVLESDAASPPSTEGRGDQAVGAGSPRIRSGTRARDCSSRRRRPRPRRSLRRRRAPGRAHPRRHRGSPRRCASPSGARGPCSTCPRARSRTVGTRVRLEVDAAGGRPITEVFAAFTDPETPRLLQDHEDAAAVRARRPLRLAVRGEAVGTTGWSASPRSSSTSAGSS